MAIITQPIATRVNIGTRFGRRTNVANSSKVRLSGKLFEGTPSAAVISAARRTRLETLRTAKQLTPVDTGLLRGKWRSSVKPSLRGVSLELANNTEYAGFVEFGTRHMSARLMGTRAMEQVSDVFRRNLEVELATTLGATLEGVERSIASGITELVTRRRRPQQSQRGE